MLLALFTFANNERFVYGEKYKFNNEWSSEMINYSKMSVSRFEKWPQIQWVCHFHAKWQRYLPPSLSFTPIAEKWMAYHTAVSSIRLYENLSKHKPLFSVYKQSSANYQLWYLVTESFRSQTFSGSLNIVVLSFKSFYYFHARSRLILVQRIFMT